MEQLTYSGVLTVLSCWCGLRHAVPEELRDLQERQHADGRPVQSIYCPLGHQHQPAGKAEVEKIRERLEREQRRSASLTAQNDQLEASRRALKGAATKARRRAANGVCPCCQRTFVNVARHVATKHPEFVEETGLS